jgi:hypothetical protein
MPLCLLPSVDLETPYLLAISVYVKVSHSSRLSIAASASSMRLILVELWGVGVGCNSLQRHREHLQVNLRPTLPDTPRLATASHVNIRRSTYTLHH